MRHLAFTLAFLSGLIPAVTPVHAAKRPAVITVRNPIILLGELVPGLDPEIANLEFGPAPAPGMSRTIRATEIRAKLVNARANDTSPMLPSFVRVRREAQTINSIALEELVRTSLQTLLPPSVKLRSVSVRGGLVTAAGTLSITPPQPIAWRAGRQLVSLRLNADGMPTRDLLVSVELELLSRREAPAVTRGQQISVLATVGTVTVRARGITQEAGCVGDTVNLIVDEGHRVIKGIVRSADTVEVLP